MSQSGIAGMNGGGGGGGGSLSTLTGNDGVVVSPNGSHNINLDGNVVANATHATAVFTESPSANTENIDIQVAAAIASTDITKVGLAAFNSADFTVDANGFVSSVGGGGITTINGDTGSITGSTVTIYANNSVRGAGASVSFVNSGTVSTLNLTDAGFNVFLGLEAGSLTTTGIENVGIGPDSLANVADGSLNVAIGVNTLINLSSGSLNVVIGTQSLENISTGFFNTVIGASSGNLLLSNESSNILFSNEGALNESNTIRIGTQGSSNVGATAQQDRCFIAGIVGVTTSNSEMVTIDSTTGQLGVAAIPVPPVTRYPITPFVVGPIGQAGYQTIQSALDAANVAGGGSVYVQAGAYVENLTLYPNVQIVGVTGNSDETGVGTDITISGTHTPSDTGYTTISNVYLESTGDILFSIDAGTCDIALQNCNIGITGSGYTFNLVNWTGQLIKYDVQDNSVNNGVVNNTAGANCFFQNSNMGAGTANSMVTSGITTMKRVHMQAPWSAGSGTLVVADFATFTRPVTMNGTAGGEFNFCRLSPSTFTSDPGLIWNSSALVLELEMCIIDSTNTFAIDGTGTGNLVVGSVGFVQSTGINPAITTVALGGFIPNAFGTTGQVWTSNGQGNVPTFQNAGGGGGITGPVSSTNTGIATWNGTGGAALNSPPTPLVSSGGVMTNSNQPAFYAYVNGAQINVTGDGTQVLVSYNAVLFDHGSNFNTGGSFFLCPVTGIYQFNVNILLYASVLGTNTAIQTILFNGATNVSQINYGNSFATGLLGAGATSSTGSVTIACTAGDQISVQTLVLGNASKNIDILGSPQFSSFSGFLVA